MTDVLGDHGVVQGQCFPLAMQVRKFISSIKDSKVKISPLTFDLVAQTLGDNLNISSSVKVKSAAFAFLIT